MHLGRITVLWAVRGVDNDVRSLREARGLTQAQLGAALGVSRQSVNSIEKGRYDPSLGHRHRPLLRDHR